MLLLGAARQKPRILRPDVECLLLVKETPEAPKVTQALTCMFSCPSFLDAKDPITKDTAIMIADNKEVEQELS